MIQAAAKRRGPPAFAPVLGQRRVITPKSLSKNLLSVELNPASPATRLRTAAKRAPLEGQQPSVSIVEWLQAFAAKKDPFSGSDRPSFGEVGNNRSHYIAIYPNFHRNALGQEGHSCLPKNKLVWA